MSEYEELVRRLRYLGRDAEAYETNAIIQAADAIEAQAARIAELERQLVFSKAAEAGAGSLLLDVQNDCIKERAKVARLVKVLSRLETWPASYDAQPSRIMAEYARAALKDAQS